jgi:hypothetical protein
LSKWESPSLIQITSDPLTDAYNHFFHLKYR